MLKTRFLTVALVLAAVGARAELRELVPQEVLRQIAEETSGESAKRNLDTITLEHRMRGSRQFDNATQHILRQLERYGLDEVALLEFPADGETMFGTQKSRAVWSVRFAELWELGEIDGATRRVRRLGDWDAVPLSLAQDSLSGEVTASLIDIGAGTADADYRGKDLRHKLVLTSSQPGRVVERAVGELGAAGIISYAPNQRSAWWRQDDRLVRWGHLESFPETRSFAFMISLGEARRLQQRLATGEEIRFHAKVDASHERGVYAFATAAILGTDRATQEIIFTCHLDHPRPGANDNASGCVAILETARALNALIKAEILPRPSRTIRFLWPAEIEGSIIYLTQHPDTSAIKANIHMDMVGGGPVTKSVFRISGGPISLPTFISDLGFEIGHFVNEQTERFASGEAVAFPLIASEGGKEPLLALMEGLDMGSDHDVFRESSWGIPGLYLHDWPDRYIHTNFDLAANIDPTKLKRSAFIGAVSGWFLANMSEDDVPAVLSLLERNALERSRELLERRQALSPADEARVTAIHFTVERRKIRSIQDFAPLAKDHHDAALAFLAGLEDLIGIGDTYKSGQPAENTADSGSYLSPSPRIDTIYERNPAVQGPMSAFGYSYLRDKYTEEKYQALSLPRFTGTHGSGGQYVYETLNLVDGRRSVSDIRDWLTTELGPVPVEHVSEYLEALATIDVVRIKR